MFKCFIIFLTVLMYLIIAYADVIPGLGQSEIGFGLPTTFLLIYALVQGAAALIQTFEKPDKKRIDKDDSL